MAALLPLLLIGVALYFVVLPQRRRAQAQRMLATSLTPGERVVTAGGMIGTLVAVEEDHVTVEVAEGVAIDMLIPAIVRRLDPPQSPADVPPVAPPVDYDTEVHTDVDTTEEP